MKSAIVAAALSATLPLPSMSFAQNSDGLVTRQQVINELVQLRQAGYKLSRAQYPDNIQAAERRIAAQRDGATSASSTTATVDRRSGNQAAANDAIQRHSGLNGAVSSVGGSMSGTSVSGSHASASGWQVMFTHH
ncbi:DUF4148 domain-containing protein [Paraburkholderia sp. PGU19]|uniref:DUF4148 domain-containing protein n=1 Tax=Paraburkholderia sp. PGU19 TaxID=2735434 RepID=UPI0015DB2B71|nr:DUF4148 domain-containing protein [Paraburkholderia sp. PGU19]